MKVTIDGVEYAPVVREEVVLSVLVPSVSSRRATFAPKIADALYGQHEALSEADQARVEILIVTDAKGMLIGDKRNAMVRLARGKYVVFVDDDDRVEHDYISTLLAATDSDADCITFEAMVKLNGGPAKRCVYSKDFQKDSNASDHYQRLPNHICAVRRILALSTPFPSKQFGEDADYAQRLKPLLSTECQLKRVLYHYDYSDLTTETQGKQKLRAVPQPAVVDVVIMSNAQTPELRAMTQKAINSCVEGAAPYKINVIVMEQDAESGYVDARVYRNTGEFNYNRSANQAAARGQAEWIMVANNDLVFEPGWLLALIQAERECVSPVDPNHRTQRSIRSDEAGWVVGRNFSGWCFMVKRDLWERIGKFDETVTYWCSDNIVVEQLRAVNVMPMVVPGARVQHLGSITGGKQPSDALSWANVEIFNKKYPQRPLFNNDSRYLHYLRNKAA